jgi:hypothetical protein
MRVAQLYELLLELFGDPMPNRVPCPRLIVQPHGPVLTEAA